MPANLRCSTCRSERAGQDHPTAGPADGQEGRRGSVTGAATTDADDAGTPRRRRPSATHAPLSKRRRTSVPHAAAAPPGGAVSAFVVEPMAAVGTRRGARREVGVLEHSAGRRLLYALLDTPLADAHGVHCYCVGFFRVELYCDCVIYVV